jgi:hypothetical protein
MTKRKGQKDKQLSTKPFNEKKLNWVQTIDLNLLTCGSDDLTYEENINIFKHVFNFIKSSERFLVV